MAVGADERGAVAAGWPVRPEAKRQPGGRPVPQAATAAPRQLCSLGPCWTDVRMNTECRSRARSAAHNGADVDETTTGLQTPYPRPARMSIPCSRVAALAPTARLDELFELFVPQEAAGEAGFSLVLSSRTWRPSVPVNESIRNARERTCGILSAALPVLARGALCPKLWAETRRNGRTSHVSPKQYMGAAASQPPRPAGRARPPAAFHRDCSVPAGGCLTVHRTGRLADGFGAQLLAALSGYGHCKRCRCNYAHVLIGGMYLSAERGSHFDTNMSSSVLRANELTSELFAHLHVGVHALPPPGCTRFPMLHKENNAHASHIFTNGLTASLRSAWPLKAPPRYFARDCTNVAVHVRRHDIKEGSTWRWQSDDRVEQCLLKISTQFSQQQQPVCFHVFSWSSRPRLRLENVTFHVGDEKDTFDTFNAFVHADALVVGMSSFSTAAALFHPGERVYVPGGTWLPILGFKAPSSWQEC